MPCRYSRVFHQFNNMKNFLASIILASFLVIPGFVLAQGEDCTDTSASNGELCNALPSFGGINVNNLQELVVAVLVWGGTVIATLAMIMIIYAGVRMIFSQGDPQAITSAKSTMFYAIGGFVIASFAYVIVASIEFFLGVSNQPGGDSFFVNPLSLDTAEGLLVRIVGLILSVAGTIAVLFIVIGGFRYVMAGGNEEQVKKAKGTVTWAVIGLIIILVSYTIMSVIRNTLASAQ